MRLLSALLLLVAVPALGADKQRKKLEDLPPWASEPNQVKLEIAERLVLEKKQYEAAIPLIAAIRSEGVNAPVLDLLQGIAMREQGLHVDSERALLAARKKMPGDARVHEALCVLYADTRVLDQAVEACEKASRLDPSSASIWNNLGYLYLVTQRPNDALESAQRAVDLDASENRYRNNLALAYVAVDDTHSALSTFETTGSKADALYRVGFALEVQEGDDTAMEWYRRALEINPRHVAANQAVEQLSNPTTEPVEESP